MFAVTKEASECLTIAQHSVCCSQEFFASRSLPSSISERAVPTAESSKVRLADHPSGIGSAFIKAVRQLPDSHDRLVSAIIKGVAKTASRSFVGSQRCL